MSTDSVLNEDTKSTSLPADVSDDSCVVKYIEIVPLTRDTDGPCITECDSGDWSAQVKQEDLPVVKQEPQDVCYLFHVVAVCYKAQEFFAVLCCNINCLQIEENKD